MAVASHRRNQASALFNFAKTVGFSVGVTFVATISANGSTSVISTFLSGSAHAIAVDSSGVVYVTGENNGNLPVTSDALQGTYPGVRAVFIAKIDPNGSPPPDDGGGNGNGNGGGKGKPKK